MEEKTIYEFNFEHLCIRHFLLLCRFSQAQKEGNNSLMADFIEMSVEFCDFDPLDLPFSELDNFLEQFAAALTIAFRKPEE